MIENLSSLIDDKRVLLLGFGKEGRATYKLIGDIGLYAKLGIADINNPQDVFDAKIHSGEGYLDCMEKYDVVFKSPGVVLPKDYREYTCKITSQTEMFLESYRRQVIGITGTKGKSTVSSLLYHVLHSHGIPCILAGNIGIPVFEILDDIKPETTIILELSSHQLEICRVSPAVSVLLNIYEDHLDHYGTFEKYVRAKKNIYLHQHPSDVLYCDKSVVPSEGESVSHTIIIDKGMLPFDSLDAIEGAPLRGAHNLGNCAFVYSIAKTFGVTDEEFIEALKSFGLLRHRLEFIGTKNGVDYYDDSISTTVESTINAIESIPNASTIMLGGMDRGIDYTALVDYLAKSKLANVICMYRSGERIYQSLMELDKVNPALYYCNDLFDATKTAQDVTIPRAACILSPASASYDDFTNFEERGDVFRSIIFGV